jgi:hypothetical protein
MARAAKAAGEEIWGRKVTARFSVFCVYFFATLIPD